MKIHKNLCAGCGACVEQCSLGDISYRRKDEKTGRYYFEIDQDECVECGSCLRAGVCKTEALHQPALEYPRTLRAHFSDPLVEHPGTNVRGRGTEEIKTLEVTRRLPGDCVAISCEMGRPAVGARFSEVQKLTTALAGLGVEFEDKNPCTQLMDDAHAGTFKQDVLDTKVLSAIVEMTVPLAKAPDVLRSIRKVSKEVDCPFSVALITLLDENKNSSAKALLEEVQWVPLPNVKLNTGLGKRPGE